MLKRHLFKHQIFVYNLGVSGDDTNDLLRRISNECKARKPGAVIIAIGGNDSQYLIDKKKLRLPLDQFSQNIDKIIEVTKKHCDKIILIGLTRVNEDKINPEYIMKLKRYYKNKHLKVYDQEIEKQAKINSIKYISVFDEVKDKYLVDGLHPNHEGHRLLFTKIVNSINPEDLS